MTARMASDVAIGPVSAWNKGLQRRLHRLERALGEGSPAKREERCGNAGDTAAERGYADVMITYSRLNTKPETQRGSGLPV